MAPRGTSNRRSKLEEETRIWVLDNNFSTPLSLVLYFTKVPRKLILFHSTWLHKRHDKAHIDARVSRVPIHTCPCPLDWEYTRKRKVQMDGSMLGQNLIFRDTSNVMYCFPIDLCLVIHELVRTMCRQQPALSNGPIQVGTKPIVTPFFNTTGRSHCVSSKAFQWILSLILLDPWNQIVDGGFLRDLSGTCQSSTWHW